MTESNAALEDAKLNGQGSDKDGGEPEGSADRSREPEGKDGKSDKEPSREGLFDGMTAEDLHKSYKSIQSEYTKAKDKIKKLENYGGVEKVVQWVEYLSNDPEFAEFVKKKQSKDSYGIDPDEADEETKKGIQMVEKIFDSKFKQYMNKFNSEYVEPVGQTVQSMKLAQAMTEMDAKYGDAWREFEPDIKEIVVEMPAKQANTMDFKKFEGLLWTILADKGQIANFGKRMYEKSLEDKKKKSTGEPSNAHQKHEPKRSKTIREAWDSAKQMVAG